MRSKTRKWGRRLVLAALAIFLAFTAAGVSGAAPVLRIKDIARVSGTDANTLTGVGLVVGLAGTGDGRATAATQQILANMLKKFGVSVTEQGLRGRNSAVVVVTASLQTFTRPGERLDVTVASLGDARSLAGGVLINTELRAADGKVYALAGGTLLVGGASIKAGGSSYQKNQATVGRIPGGALVIRPLPGELLDAQGNLSLILDQPDFTTAARVAAVINEVYGAGTARALDDRTVSLQVPARSREEGEEGLVSFLAAVEQLPVTVDQPARVVVDARTGTVIIGGAVKIAEAAVAQGNISVRISARSEVSQPYPWSGGETEVTQEQEIKVQEEKGRSLLLAGGARVDELVKAMNAVGATPQDLIAILQALKAQGALYGELIVQ